MSKLAWKPLLFLAVLISGLGKLTLYGTNPLLSFTSSNLPVVVINTENRATIVDEPFENHSF
jgi:hypothetical protein